MKDYLYRFLRLALIGSVLSPLLASAGCSSADKPLLGGAWDDLSIYEANLIRSEEASLQGLRGASIYHLDISIADDLQSVSGREQVRYTNRENVDLNELYFQLFPDVSGGQTAISSVEVDKKKVGYSTVSGDGFLRVPLSRPIKPGAAVTIQIDFKVSVPPNPSGSFGLFGYNDGILALDGFYPVIPVYDTAGWHIEPAPPNGDKTYLDVAFYLARVEAPAAITLVSSGVEMEQQSKGDKQVVTFASGPSRDFYLAGSGRFNKLSTATGETTINSYYLPGQIDGAQLALSAAENAIKIFSTRLGLYPYTELDILPLAMQGGGIGIEYPGVIGIATGVYSINATLESTVVHETGHQWFYNVIGNDQIGEPWLDESLTQYITGLYYLDIYGAAGWEYAEQSWLNFWRRAGYEEIPIGLPVGEYQGAQYGPIVYGRGPVFVAALAEEIGTAFEGCLRQYYLGNKWGIVTAEDFQGWFEGCSGKELDYLFNEWVLP